MLEEGRRSGERTRGEQVVGREEDDVVPVDPCQAVVVGGDVADVARVLENANANVGCRQGFGDLAAAVGRGVVDHEHVDVDIGLGEDALQQPAR